MSKFRSLFSTTHVIHALLFLIIITVGYRFFKNREEFSIQGNPMIAMRVMSMAQAQAQSQGLEAAMV